MFSKLFARGRTRPAIIATIAVCIGVTGVALAAGGFVGKTGKIHGCVGDHGALSVVKAGKKCPSGTTSLVWNQRGPRGLRGARGPAGPFPGVLPRGKTIRGNYWVGGRMDKTDVNDTDPGAISFGFTLAAAPTPHVISEGGAVPSGCTGSVDNPGAAPGNLCIFEKHHDNLDHIQACDNVQNTCPGADRFGAGIEAQGNPSAANDLQWQSFGTWAVTSP